MNKACVTLRETDLKWDITNSKNIGMLVKSKSSNLKGSDICE